MFLSLFGPLFVCTHLVAPSGPAVSTAVRSVAFVRRAVLRARSDRRTSAPFPSRNAFTMASTRVPLAAPPPKAFCNTTAARSRKNAADVSVSAAFASATAECGAEVAPRPATAPDGPRRNTRDRFTARSPALFLPVPAPPCASSDLTCRPARRPFLEASWEPGRNTCQATDAPGWSGSLFTLLLSMGCSDFTSPHGSRVLPREGAEGVGGVSTTATNSGLSPDVDSAPSS
mmetsp:Transcript_92487/g.298965  ORF Transcript_92487/g.298965 Transcript_92487/m.298965 type:complete len:230 (-) Transcript_92487:126-815(-)